MTQYIFANNVNTTLFSAISSTATSLTLLSATNLPTLAAGQIMPLTLNDKATRTVFEIVYVTAISGTTLTVIRGQEGTAAQNWNAGDYAYSTQTAQTTELAIQSGAYNYAVDTGTVANAYAMAPNPAISSYTPGMLLSLGSIKTSNNGPSTLAVSGLTALPIQGPGGTALQGGELVATYGAFLRVNAAATAFELLQTTGGSLPVKAATASNHATNLGQLQNSSLALSLQALNITQSGGTGSTYNPSLNGSINESYSAGTGFYIANALVSTRSGGTGNRESLHVEQLTGVAAVGENVVGIMGLGHLTGTSSGDCFGMNSYAWADSTVASSAEIVSIECDTDVRAPVTLKVGIQIIDVATSTNSGTSLDCGLLISNQTGGVGYSVGIRFGNGSNSGILSGGTLIYAAASSQTFNAGIDFSGLTTMTVSPIVLAPNTKGIYWGATKAGGSVVSETATGGGDIVLANGEHAFRFAGTITHTFTPTSTYLIFYDGTTTYFRQCLVGAASSAGTGYRQVMVAN